MKPKFFLKSLILYSPKSNCFGQDLYLHSTLADFLQESHLQPVRLKPPLHEICCLEVLI